MSKRMILCCDGSLEAGFKVILEIPKAAESLPIVEGQKRLSSVFTEVIGTLPPAIELRELLITWQQHYLGSVGVTRIYLENIGTRLGISAERDKCRQLAKELQQALTRWLASAQFQLIEQRLRETLTVQEPVEVVLRTNDERLHRLPWHLWDLIDCYPHAELSIGSFVSSPELVTQPRESHHRVRILAILGDRQGIDIEADCQVLASLPHTDVVFLVEPSRQVLHSHLWEKTWDVLFFAGHSNTEQQQGRIHLSASESLTIEELRYGLRRAIERGLQLAIFNSCDGLGLAYELEQLHIPQSIVMREPVPDRVALDFLKQFLSTFAGGTPLYPAVRQAREYLQGLESEFPCASWLPVVFQNPAVPPLTWSALQGNPIVPPAPLPTPKPRPRKRLLLWAIATSFAVAGLTMGIRYFGLLQSSELNAYDTLMRLRPAEKPDDRITIVTVTEADVEAQRQAQETSRGSLSDESLAKLIDKLEPYRPIAIGLAIHRDYPVSKVYPLLATKLRSTRDNLGDSPIFGVCKASELEAENPGVKPPPEISPNRIGFSDVLIDPDGIVRRHYLATLPTSSLCQTPYGLSLQLALRYLAHKEINFELSLILGKIDFPLLDGHTEGYQKNNALGYQIMLNYRATPTPLDLATRVTMADVLDGKISPDKIKDRIILIGTTAPSFHDYLSTPYTTAEGKLQEIPGVVLQAQMVSQLLSAVRDKRPLIRSWDFDGIWVWGWAISGGFLAIWLRRRPLYLVLGTGIAIVILAGSCLALLLGGYWVPLIPGAMAIVGTEGILALIMGTDRKETHPSFRN
jgi:CHASE2 domain-containing sensor protein